MGLARTSPLAKTELTWPGEFYFVLKRCGFGVFGILTLKLNVKLHMSSSPDVRPNGTSAVLSLSMPPAAHSCTPLAKSQTYFESLHGKYDDNELGNIPYYVKAVFVAVC